MVAARGEDLRFDLRLDFRRAIWGGEETIRIQHLETCQACDGRGEQRQGLGNWFRGEPSAVCNACSGNGRTEVLKDLTVTIPPGVEEGTRLRVYEEGDAGERGGEPGDLYLFLSVGEDSEFKRDGTSLLSEISIKQEEAASGCQVQVKTIDGTIETLTIPPGIQPNTVLTLQSRGVPVLGNPEQRGDHLINIKIEAGNQAQSSSSETPLEKSDGNINDDPLYKNLLFVDQSIEELIMEYDSIDTLLSEPFKHLRNRNLEAAKESLRPILDNPVAEIRHKLWVWRELRQLGEVPPSDVADDVHGVVLEMPLERWVDTLAVYSDGRVRYLNGKLGSSGLIMIEDTEHPRIKPLAMQVISSSQSLVGVTPVVDRHNEEPPTDQPRVSALTFKGLYIVDRSSHNKELIDSIFAIGAQLLVTVIDVAKRS